MRETYSLARVAVLVRAPGSWLFWLGVVAAAPGLLVPGFTGRRIGLAGGAALFLVAGAVVFALRRGRYRELADRADRAGTAVVLESTRVTARRWLRRRRGWLVVAFVLAAGSVLLAAAAGGLLLAGVGAGLRAKASWLGRWERDHDRLLWLRLTDVPDRRLRAGSPTAAGPGHGFYTTGPAAGDAGPGSGQRRLAAARR